VALKFAANRPMVAASKTARPGGGRRGSRANFQNSRGADSLARRGGFLSAAPDIPLGLLPGQCADRVHTRLRVPGASRRGAMETFSRKAQRNGKGAVPRGRSPFGSFEVVDDEKT
jgi:hypothetical protein